MEKELIWIFGHIPGFSATLPSVIAKLHAAKDKYLSPQAAVSSSSQMEVGFFSTNQWCLSLNDLTAINYQLPFSYWFVNTLQFYHAQDKQWNFSFTFVWNSIVWLVLLNFFIKIITSTAQDYLKKQQDMEIELVSDSPVPDHSKTN